MSYPFNHAINLDDVCDGAFSSQLEDVARAMNTFSHTEIQHKAVRPQVALPSCLNKNRSSSPPSRTSSPLSASSASASGSPPSLSSSPTPASSSSSTPSTAFGFEYGAQDPRQSRVFGSTPPPKLAFDPFGANTAKPVDHHHHHHPTKHFNHHPHQYNYGPSQPQLGFKDTSAFAFAFAQRQHTPAYSQYSTKNMSSYSRALSGHWPSADIWGTSATSVWA